MKCLKMLLAIIMVIGIASVGWATPIVNANGDGIEDVAGQAYAYYQNSGSWMFTLPGNNEGDPHHAALVAYMWTNYGVVLTAATPTAIDIYDGASGTWESSTLPPSLLSYYVVMAGNIFAMYEVNPAASNGSWSTYDVWLAGAGSPNEPVRISHLTGYNPSSVPEPTTLFLLGLGLVGIAGIRRKLTK